MNIVTDFHVLPIAGCQMVLGVDWLKTFDALTLSYKDQMIKVTKGGRTWEIQGTQLEDMKMVKAEAMDKTLFQAVKGWVLLCATRV